MSAHAWIGLSTVALVLGGCLASAPPAPPGTPPFSPEEAAFIRKSGSGVITGHAFRTRPRGQVVNAAGEVVRLVPATAYASERFNRLYRGGRFIPADGYPEDKPDPLYVEYTRSTKTTATGRFRFEDVAPGRYFVTTQVVWNERNTLFRDGGSVYDEVTLTGRETKPVEVILSGK